MSPQYGEGGERAFMRLQAGIVGYDGGRVAVCVEDAGISPPLTVPAEGGEEGRRSSGPRGRFTSAGRQGIVVPIMPCESPQFNKYKLIMLLSPLLLIGAIPVWIYVARKMRRKAEGEGGVLFTLNYWPAGTDGGGHGGGEKAAMSIFLNMLPTDSYVGDQEHKFKRTRCDELELVGRYATRGWEGEGVALLPEVRFGS